MPTQCNANAHRKSTRRPAQSRPVLDLPAPEAVYLDFPALGSREVLASFDGGDISSDGGALLLRQVEQLTAIIRQLAGRFTDQRDPGLIEHPLEHLIARRAYALALGYEDLNDHDDLRHDPLLATVVGKLDPEGTSRRRPSDRGKSLAGKSTLNRIALTPVGADRTDRYKKVTCSTRRVDDLFVDLFLRSHARPPESIVPDIDATDDPTHGQQPGRSLHGYYKGYCYLPPYISCGDQLLCATLRPSDIGASAGAVKHPQRIIAAIRRAWPQVKVLIRGDSGFCREPIMAWCEAHGVDYLLGRPQDKRPLEPITEPSGQARQESRRTGEPARVFAEFGYRTPSSWGRLRRVIAKAEHLPKGANPRFVVTSLSVDRREARALYEEDYCARGEMEDRIKEQQLHLFADRTSCQTMRADRIRLSFSSVAYVSLEAPRRPGLSGTEMAGGRCQTIRLKLLKIGAPVRVAVRKVWVSLASSCPYAGLFRRVHERLSGLSPPAAAMA